MDQFNPRDMIMTPLFGLMNFLLIFLVPVITMRLFSEEKKLGTIELLFTYPLTELQMVMGKFLAAVTVMFVIYGFSFIYFILYFKYFAGTPGIDAGFFATLSTWIKNAPWGTVAAGYLGLFLVSTSFLSFGMWISSLTSDQVSSALGTIGGLLLFWVIGAGKIDAQPPLSDVLAQLSITEHSQNFSKGIIDTHDVVFFVCFILFFLYLTVQILEVRKWKD